MYAREIINLMAREERKKFRKLFYFGGKSDKYAKKPRLRFLAVIGRNCTKKQGSLWAFISSNK